MPRFWVINEETGERLEFVYLASEGKPQVGNSLHVSERDLSVKVYKIVEVEE